MNKQSLFQFAVLYHEKVISVLGNQNQEKIKSQVLIEPKTILAQDEKSATIQIAKQIPDDYMDKLSDIEILLRPF